MKSLALAILLVGSSAGTVFAAPPASAPNGAMGLCKDGTYSSSAEKKGACRGHQGVKDWYGQEGGAPSKPATASSVTTTTSSPVATAPAVTAPATPAAPAAPLTTTRKTSTTSVENPSGALVAQAAGAGQVWANENTKVYHCRGDKWYGKTKHGAYMSESEARAKGFHGDHGKACS